MGIEEEESERLFWHGRGKNEKGEGRGEEGKEETWGDRRKKIQRQRVRWKEGENEKDKVKG